MVEPVDDAAAKLRRAATLLVERGEIERFVESLALPVLGAGWSWERSPGRALRWTIHHADWGSLTSYGLVAAADARELLVLHSARRTGAFDLEHLIQPATLVSFDSVLLMPELLEGRRGAPLRWPEADAAAGRGLVAFMHRVFAENPPNEEWPT